MPLNSDDSLKASETYLAPTQSFSSPNPTCQKTTEKTSLTAELWSYSDHKRKSTHTPDSPWVATSLTIRGKSPHQLLTSPPPNFSSTLSSLHPLRFLWSRTSKISIFTLSHKV
eukprot:CCRYP_008138-RA/>CCRYP_008138-RA protein AED:0.45 eAED:0.45 QI:0/-1/0/1/-1/0/1/0/112